MERPKQGRQPRFLPVLLKIIAAWFTVFIFGIVLLGFSSYTAGLLFVSQSDTLVVYRVLVTDGLIGLVALAIVLLSIWKLRKTGGYFRAMLIPLWIGVGLYGLILTISLIGSLNAEVQISSASTCNSISQQLRLAEGATVPIGTDRGFGTAFAVNDNNTLLTAYHVVKDAKTISASYATGSIPLTIIRIDPADDLALLHIDRATSSHLQLTNVYNIGDQLYGYGYPENTYTAGQATLTSGIVSRILTNSDIRLTDKNAAASLELIQTDAALNHGNSGGPVFTKCGVVGVVDSVSDYLGLEGYGITGEQGIAYAVSSRTASTGLGIPILSQ